MVDRKKRIEHFLNLTNAFSDQCDAVIYHYTSSDGLKGIIENSELWLTNTAFVNDVSECKALGDEIDISVGGDIQNNHVIRSLANFKRQKDRNNTYIVSFSEGEEYLLEQLRAYGNFRIGFDAKKIRKNNFNLYRCVYTKKEIRQWIAEKSNLPEWDSELLDDAWKKAAAYRLIYDASRKYKNIHFKNEKEVRLVVHSNHTWGDFATQSMFKNDPPIYYRSHPRYNFPIPYVKYTLAEETTESDTNEKSKIESELEMKRRKLSEEQGRPRQLLPITEVLIGPMPHQNEAKLACEIILLDKGYSNVEVVVSRDIPYRGF